MTTRFTLILTQPKKLAPAIAGFTILAASIAIAIPGTPALRAQNRPATATPKFEVASVKPGCGEGAQSPTAAETKTGKTAVPSAGRTSAGRLVECRSLADLIHMAWVMYAGGTFHWAWGPQFESGPPLEGAPAWVRSDSYQIIAKPEGTQSREMMSGPMLQSLLEDRFKLKLHRDSRDVPVYQLIVAKGGPRLTASKSNCLAPIPRQPGDGGPPPTLAPGLSFCNNMIGFRKGPNTGLNSETNTLDQFSVLLGHLVDRPVVNKTGIPGKFDIHLEFAVDESTPRFLAGGDMAQMIVQPSNDPAGPSVFTAVEQQLGLKLEPVKGRAEFLVIDRVERPSPN